MKKQYDFTKAKRGALVTPVSGRTRITIRLDDETLINQALGEYMRQRPESVEEVVRRVVREEVRRIA
jgi:Arc/MetJ family transcription regulator